MSLYFMRKEIPYFFMALACICASFPLRLCWVAFNSASEALAVLKSIWEMMPLEAIKEKAKPAHFIKFNSVTLISQYFIRDVGIQSSFLMSYF